MVQISNYYRYHNFVFKLIFNELYYPSDYDTYTAVLNLKVLEHV